MKKRICLLFIVLSLLPILLYSCDDSNKNLQSKPVRGKSGIKKVGNPDTEKFNISINEDTAVVTHIAVIRTSIGNITIALYGKEAPKTVENFIGLTKIGYYKGVLFHRTARNFLIQAGDKTTKNKNKKADWGKGGDSFFGEPFEDELDSTAPGYKAGYLPGTLAMANRGPNTNTSQFFICLEDAMNLEHRWTIFGRVIAGMKVVEKISNVEVEPGRYELNDGTPKKPVIIYNIEVNKVKINNMGR